MTEITIRPWPKMVFSWPIALLAITTGILTSALPEHEALWGFIFLAAFAFISLILCFEWNRMLSLVLLLGLTALLFGSILLNQEHPFVARLVSWLSTFNYTAHPDFYFFFGGIYAVLIGLIFIRTRFEYWVLTPNELIHKKGAFGGSERFPTDGMKVHTEIIDVFEYVLGGSGTLWVQVPSQTKPILLSNVFNVRKIEEACAELLNARQVRFKSYPGVYSPLQTQTP